MTRALGRLAGWTVGWTLFMWWAVIGWPATLDEAGLALIVMSVGSSVGVSGWYCLYHLMGRWGSAS